MSLRQPLQPTDRLCFLHIVKTAGSAFSHHLKNQYRSEDISPARFWPELQAMSDEDRNRYKLISGHFAHDISKYLDQRPTRYITMLRDPVARTVSVYEYVKQSVEAAGSDHDYGKMSEYMKKFRLLMDGGMESFLRSEDRDVRLAVSNTQTLILAAGDPEALPEAVGDDMLEKAKAHLREYAYFGLTERMQESLDLLSYTFGWRPFKNVEVNVTPNKSRISSLPASLVDLIADKNRLDFELYGFADRLFSERYAQMIEDLNNRFPGVPESSGAEEGAARLHGQLERHYEQCYRENPSLVGSYSFNESLGGLPVGEGWWQWESHGEGGHRWTGPGTVSTLDVPLLTDRPLSVSFKIANSAAPDVLQSLRMEVNGRAVESRMTEDPSGYAIIRALLSPAELKSTKPFVRLDLIVNRTVSSREIDPSLPSDRKLGVAVHSVEVEPAGDRPADGMFAGIRKVFMAAFGADAARKRI